MNKRKVTKRKGSKDNKQSNNDHIMPTNKQANNDPSQVFVLPPNLLEALGIDLGNIETAPECTSGNQISENDLIYKEKSAGLHTFHNLSEIAFTTSSEKELSVTKTAGHNLFSKENLTSQGILTSIPECNYTTSSENESSIIHTANLMKASVFLSPTFISNNRSIIEGEVEILGSDKLMENAISIPNIICPKSEEYDQSDYMIGGVTSPHQNQEVFTVSNLENPKVAKSSEAVQETKKHLQSTDVHVEINKLEKVDNFDNHADEAYLSDLSNGNVEMNDKSNGSNSSVFLPTNINKKISIISEETFDPTQLKAFKSSCLNKKKCLIPVEMNTPLKSSFRNSDCYQNSINNDCDPNMVTYYVEPSVTIDSDLRDVNEQKLECEYITDLLLKNESYTETDFINHNAAAGDSLNNHLVHNILSNLSEDVVIDTQMQEDSSQHKFQGHESEYTRSVLSDTLNCKENCDLMETYTSETRNTNIVATNYEEMELNETLQKVDPNVLGIENIYVNGNLLSSVSENVTNSTQIQEVSPQHELEVHKSMFDIQVLLADTFNCEDSDRTMETNVEILSDDIKSTNTFTTKFDEEKENNTLQKVNPNALNEQKFCIDHNKVSSENKDVVITIKKQECSFKQAFEVHEKKLDPQLILMETPDSENSGNIIETTISDTKTSNTITTNYEEHNIKETSEKIDPSAVDKQNIHVDDKHQKITKAVSDKVNTKLTRTKENYKITSRDAKRKSGTIFVKDSKINSVSKLNLSRTNVNMQKLTNKVKSVKVIKKVLKRTKRKNTNLKIKDVLVKAEAKPTQKSPEELCNSCIVPDNNTKITADHSVQLGHLGINNEDHEGKIKEIAGYLRKFAELQKLKPTNTKLSIQGVEKPGGSEKGKVHKGDKNIKTYVRKRIKKPTVKVSWITPNFDSLTQNNNLSINSSYNTCMDIDFCLCDDFGRLIYYDDESMYEHIHFWNREQVDCTPDLLFSIYNEIVPAEINNDDDTKILQDYPYEIFCAPDRKVNWKETNFIDSHGFNNDGNEHTVINSRESIESISLNIDKPNETNIDIQMKPDASKRSRSPEKNTENWNIKTMENVNLLENCQETINNNIEPDVNTMKNEKKRKYSSAFNGSDKLHTENTESHLEARLKSDTIIKKQKKSKKDPEGKEIVPEDQPDSEGSFTTTSLKDTFAVCGVCKQNIKDTDWLQHIASQHNYLSWRVDEEPLDLKNRQLLIQHLATLIKQYGVLSCNKCGTTRKYAKPFLNHINQCATVEEYHPESVLSPSEFDCKSNLVSQSSSSIRHANVKKQPEPLRLVECGVCGESIHNKDWNSHTGLQHNYLAWKSGEQPLDLDDDDEVKEHLYNIVKESGGLKCGKCGLIRKYVKSYQTHIKSCDGQSVSESLNESSEGFLHIVSEVSNITVEDGPELVTDDLVKCGVCGEFMHSKAWNSHIGSQHNYLAWKHGESSLDIDDEVAVKEHLYNIVKEYGGLKCAKCDLTRKYVKSYLTHISSCNGLSDAITGCATNSSLDVSEIEPAQHASDLISSTNIENDVDTPPDVIQCAICGDSMHHNNWYDHIGTQHSYLAWRCGDPTLDFDDEEATYKHLYAITKEYGGLKCVKCGLNRKYVKSYLTHVKSCTGLSTKDDNPISDDGTPNIVVLSEAEQHPGLIKCGVCGQYMPPTDWTAHIEVKHNYLAWKDDDLPLHMNDKAELLEHLKNIVKEIETLVCVKCGTQWKFPKSYLRHIEKCYAANSSKVTDQLIIWPTAGADQVKCGVCDELVQVSLWIKHIAEEHDYLAKKIGETPLDVDDEEQVYKHLYMISKENGGLVCQKCGKERKYVRSYLEHIRKCGQDLSVTGDTTHEANTTLDTSECLVDFYSAGTCAVCEKEIEAGKWIQHIQKEHNYLAWRKGETPWDVDDEEQVYKHLYIISKENGGLVCQKCGKERKYVKSYLEHIRKCGQDLSVTGDTTHEANTTLDTSECLVDFYSAGTCAVCEKEIEAGKWIQHIQKEHNYLAWRKGETPWDVDDEEQVYKHLYIISKENGGLVCQKCGKERKYVKSYLEHIRKCGQDLSVTGDTTHEANTTLDTSECLVDFYSAGTCAVCEKEIEAGKWIQHIQKEHNYLAWRKGETPWDLDDFTQINEYLYEISKKMSGLTCSKCGLVRKYVKSYLTHIKSCDVVDFNLTSTIPDGVGPVSDKAYRCAMCQKEIEPTNWKNHAMKEHYNITWVIGETPIDIKNPYAVEKYLKEYKQSNSLKCNNCGATRASFAGFYAHIITCGKTEEQIEMFQSVCDICKNKYLCIYKNQHMMIHKVQSYNKELKMSKEKVESVSSGKRQAAEKARTVIETYSSDMSKHSHKCSTCGFGTDFEEELQSHKCNQNEKDFSEEESSAAEEEGSEDESADSEVDSDISREEEDQLQTLRRKRCKESVSGGSTLSKINFKVDNPDEYVEESDIDFCNAFYTDETLFSKWISCKRETVSQDDLSKYLPPMEESCKVHAGFDWTTLKRFEAKSGDGTSIFVGSSIVCIRWIPPRVEDITGDSKNFLAIACHNDVDCPRYNCDELPQYENLIQIWDFGTFKELPQIVYGIAHDFGIVWSMDWCPSGARDVLAEDLADGRPPRLGLLAVACSNGSTYIFSVPHPSAVVENNYFVQKLKPVAELRMKMMEKSERKLYQATSVSWSKEKGHETIVVGYGDGTLGYYYINNTSPVSWRVEDEVDIYFPYNEERPHNTCITATDIKPRTDGGFLVCSASNTGAEMRIPGEHAAVRSDLPAREAIFMPHWPATLLAGVPAIMSTAQNVLEWAPPARKLGGVRALAGCARCGRVAASAPPALRAMRPHPAYPDFKKPIIGMIEMIPLEKTRKVQGNDEVTIQIEPFTYPEVIVKYGIQFQSVSERDMVLQQQCALKPKVLVPNRFPLAEVESMAFCPTKRHHDKLAVATHSGIVFLTDINL